MSLKQRKFQPRAMASSDGACRPAAQKAQRMNPNSSSVDPIRTVLAAGLGAQTEALGGYPVETLFKQLLSSLDGDAAGCEHARELADCTLTVWIKVLTDDLAHFPAANTAALSHIRHDMDATRRALIQARALIPRLQAVAARPN
jgi:hypothetical protein